MLAVKVCVIVIAALPPLDTVRTVKIHDKDEFLPVCSPFGMGLSTHNTWSTSEESPLGHLGTEEPSQWNATKIQLHGPTESNHRSRRPFFGNLLLGYLLGGERAFGMQHAGDRQRCG